MKNLKMNQERLLPQPFVPVLPWNQGPAASSRGPAASANSGDENTEHSDEYSARMEGLWKDSALPILLVS